MKNRIVLVALLGVLTACLGTWRVDDFDKLIRFDLPERVGQIIDLSVETQFRWDRVVFYGPYTPLNQIEQETGFQVPRDLEQEYALTDDTAYVPESVGVIVFAVNGGLVRGYQFSRTDVDITALTGRAFNADAARFRVVKKDTWIILEPSE